MDVTQSAFQNENDDGRVCICRVCFAALQFLLGTAKLILFDLLNELAGIQG